MERNQIAAIVIGVSVLIGATPFILDSVLLDKEVDVYKTSGTAVFAEQKDLENITVGVDTGNNLKFGKIPINAGVTKSLDIGVNRSAVFTTEASGNITEYLNLPETTRFNDTRRFGFTFEPTKTGYYEGEIRVKILVAKSSLGERWLDIRSQLY